MEPALDVLNRALLGDPGARSFLERTSSIYILDVTDLSNPKTYGCWNFIHQAMNEVERYEAAYMRSGDCDRQEAGSTSGVAAALVNGNRAGAGAGLVHHVRLLASMALRVARRSPSGDRRLVMTCIANSEKFDGTESQSQWLIDLNLELREIVMGRIAAMAFDFTFHRRVGEQGYSAFADRVVRDTLCAVLSANAVASGPAAIRHFSTEWIIPSSRNLPPFALASVVHHLALEGSRKTAPVGTKDMLQQLSVQVMSVVLVPVLVELIGDNSGHEATIAKCFRSMTSWCKATDLSLPQIRHICGKVRIDVVTVVNDAMYSDSPDVVDALAQLVETLVAEAVQTPVPFDRMNQVRHIIQVDESSFQSRFSLDQLKVIEIKEMEAIVGDLVSAVGLQRFRFIMRQNAGEHDVCRNLARIAASICTVCVDEGNGVSVNPDPGVVELLHKAAAHPFVHISAIALASLIDVTRRGYAGAGTLLPVLQRRAIVPHLIVPPGRLTIIAHEICGVSFHEFESFRNGILSEFLRVCWRIDPTNFMDSCTAAIEEFCSTQHVSPELSLQLEAALFCVEVVSRETASSGSSIPHPNQLTRIVSAIGARPAVIFSNPLTLARMCLVIEQLAHWLAGQGMVAAATGLTAEAYRSGTSSQSEYQGVAEESGISVSSTSSNALKGLCLASPKDLVHESSLNVLADIWKESCKPLNTVMTLDDRLAVGAALCTVISALPIERQALAFDSVTSCLLDSFETMVAALRVSEGSPTFDSGLSRLANVISIMASLPRMIATAGTASNGGMQSGCDTSPHALPKPSGSVVGMLGRSWSSLGYVCENYAGNDDVSKALCEMLSQWLPSPPLDSTSKVLVASLLSLARSTAKTVHGTGHFQHLFKFLQRFVHTYGEGIEKAAVATLRNELPVEDDREFGRMLQEVIVHIIDAARPSLGAAWSRPREQRHGQQPFETKASLPRVETVPDDSLSGVFSFTTECLVTCPVFLLHLQALLSHDERQEDLFVRRVAESAISALNDQDPDVARCAMKVLKTIVMNATPQHSELQAFLAETLSRGSSDLLCRLLLGVCGKMKRELIGDVADLLTAVLQETFVQEIDAQFMTALRQDCFLLGDPARKAALSVFHRCAQRQVDGSVLASFLEAMWDLHQVEDADALPGSESVARLVIQYA